MKQFREYLGEIHQLSILRIISFLITSILVSAFVIYVYEFSFNYNTLLFLILIPIMISPFFFIRDIMHPFNIFFINTQFLFVFNMLDYNAQKGTFRYGSLSGDYYDTAFMWSIFVIVLWYLFMYFGYALVKDNKKSGLFWRQKLGLKNPTKVAFMLIIIGLSSYVYIVGLKGGLLGVISALANRTDAYAGLTYFLKLTGFISIGSLILLGKGYKKTSVVFIIISFFMLISFGGRAGAFFGSIFPFLVFYHYRVKRLKILKLIPLGIVTILFAIGLGNYRLYQETRIDLTGFYDMISKIASGTQGGETLPSLIGSLIKGNVDYQYGSTLINIIFAPIPRTIWENKPQVDETGIIGKALMGSEFWGLPAGPYGVSFFNFGFIGVILIAFCTGIIVSKMYQSFVLYNNENTALIFYILIITSIFNIVSTSAQINVLWYLGVFLVIKLLDILISSFSSKEDIRLIKAQEINDNTS